MLSRVLASGLLLALASSPALSASPAESDATKAKRPTPTPHASTDVGMRAYVDPESGQLISQPPQRQPNPTAGTAADGSPMINLDGDSEVYTQAVSFPNSVPGTAADGSPMIVLNGDSEMAMAVHVDAEGRRQVACTDATHGHAVGALHADAAASTRPEER